MPEFPNELRYLWYWWCEIHGKDLVTFGEILAWSTLKHIELEQFEVDTIRQIDILFFRGK